MGILILSIRLFIAKVMGWKTFTLLSVLMTMLLKILKLLRVTRKKLCAILIGKLRVVRKTLLVKFLILIWFGEDVIIPILLVMVLGVAIIIRLVCIFMMRRKIFVRFIRWDPFPVFLRTRLAIRIWMILRKLHLDLTTFGIVLIVRRKRWNRTCRGAPLFARSNRNLPKFASRTRTGRRTLRKEVRPSFVLSTMILKLITLRRTRI